MMLDIGCGEKVRPGYHGVDMRPLPGVFLCRADEILTIVEPGSVAAIYSRHMIEHLTFAAVTRTLAVWHTALAPGGTVELITPDLEYHARQLLVDPEEPSAFNRTITNRQHALRSLFGWQRDDDWDLHHSGFTEATLRRELTRAGFHGVRRVLGLPPWHLHMTGVA